VPLGPAGDLREMRHAQHLGTLGQPRQARADRGGRCAADGNIYFIEDQGGAIARFRQRHDQRQQHAGKLPARRDFIQGPHWCARVSGKKELHRFRAGFARRLQRRQFDAEASGRHRQVREFALNELAEARGCCRTHGAECAGIFYQSLVRGRASAFELRAAFVALEESVRLGSITLGRFENTRQRAAVLLDELVGTRLGFERALRRAKVARVRKAV